MSCGQCTRWHRRESRLDTSSGHMKRNGSMTRKHNIHELKYIIHMSTVLFATRTDSRIFAPRGYVVLSPTGADSRTLRYDTHRALQRGSRPTSSQTETSSLANVNPAKLHSWLPPHRGACARYQREPVLHQEETYELPYGHITTDGAIRLLSFQPSPTGKGCQQLPPLPFFLSAMKHYFNIRKELYTNALLPGARPSSKEFCAHDDGFDGSFKVAAPPV